MRYVTLGDVCKKGSSNVALKDILSNDGKYPIYGASGFIKTVDFYHQEQDYIAIVKDGAGVGRTMLLPKQSSVIGTMQYIIPNELVDIKYLYYAVVYMNLAKYYMGAAIPHIYFKDYQTEPLKLPSLSEQKHISAIFEKIDELINQRKTQLVQLDQVVKSRFIELFGNSEHNTKRWSIAKLSSLCNVGSSKRIYQSELTETGIPFLRISDLNEKIDGKKNTPQLFIPNDKYEELQTNGLVPSVEDVLVTARGTLGKCYIIKPNDTFYFQDGMISWLSDINESITSLYISYLFSTTGVQKQIANLQAGSTVAYLSIAMLKNLDIMIPPKALQQQFAAFVAQTDKSKLAIQKSLEKLEMLKKSLMQKYFG